jgi:hypothetical protein
MQLESHRAVTDFFAAASTEPSALVWRGQPIGKHPIRFSSKPANFEVMGVRVPRLPCYLVEWYQPEFTDDELDQTAAKLEECAAVMCADGSPVQLQMTLAVPSDEVIFAVFAASSAHIVAQTCHRAGMPAQRLTAAVDATIRNVEA